ncbi:hypothetical protein EON63_00365 [archaeon]|nr:MAG: hypothetical protein EON63_00365 [archaeon]
MYLISCKYIQLAPSPTRHTRFITIHCTTTIHHILYTIHYTPYTIHHIPYIIHLTHQTYIARPR